MHVRILRIAVQGTIFFGAAVCLFLLTLFAADVALAADDLDEVRQQKFIATLSAGPNSSYLDISATLKEVPVDGFSTAPGEVAEERSMCWPAVGGLIAGTLVIAYALATWCCRRNRER